MKRYLAWAAAGLLAMSTSFGVVSAQNGVPVNADGSYVVADDDAPTNIVSGQGDDITYGNIDTGGGGGEVLGDPSAVYSPNVPAPGGGVPIIAGAGDGMIGGVPIIATVPAAPDATTQTSTTLATSEGTATENVPVEASAPPAETAPAPTPVRRPPGSAPSTRAGTTPRSPMRISARPRRTRLLCRKSTPITMESPANSTWRRDGGRPSPPCPPLLARLEKGKSRVVGG